MGGAEKLGRGVLAWCGWGPRVLGMEAMGAGEWEPRVLGLGGEGQVCLDVGAEGAGVGGHLAEWWAVRALGAVWWRYECLAMGAKGALDCKTCAGWGHGGDNRGKRTVGLEESRCVCQAGLTAVYRLVGLLWHASWVSG